jgi:enoyl-CoA hydratase/carnithine racemase
MYQLMTGEAVSAQDAYRLGMVVRLCPPAELMNIALEIAEKIARSGPTAVAAAKLAVREGLGVPMEHGMTINLEAHWRSVLHPDRGEGVKSWNEMREPNFKDPDR